MPRAASHDLPRAFPGSAAAQTARVGARAVCPTADLRLQRIADAAARAAMTARAGAPRLH